MFLTADVQCLIMDAASHSKFHELLMKLSYDAVEFRQWFFAELQFHGHGCRKEARLYSTRRYIWDMYRLRTINCTGFCLDSPKW